MLDLPEPGTPVDTVIFWYAECDMPQIILGQPLHKNIFHLILPLFDFY